ncbi:hypothetical protein L210DRAFT_1029734 [Boletus edulis BED1]|uniref:Uncharacterized protein n=1 Tax=Boletus edulis BED1 TaxID=1328754 RepID=A0AAD4BG17_BOLED|nr:hypothetical protein L210DRAFT_1029734 [Boletus edulis BED1]
MRWTSRAIRHDLPLGHATKLFSIATGIRLIPPIQHDRAVVALRFSPCGDRLVTTVYDTYVRIYNARTGDKLIVVPVQVLHTPTTPLAWSSDGLELFVVSQGTITCFNTSTSLSSEWLTHDSCTRASIVHNAVHSMFRSILCLALGRDLARADWFGHQACLRRPLHHNVSKQEVT